MLPVFSPVLMFHIADTHISNNARSPLANRLLYGGEPLSRICLTRGVGCPMPSRHILPGTFRTVAGKSADRKWLIRKPCDSECCAFAPSALACFSVNSRAHGRGYFWGVPAARPPVADFFATTVEGYGEAAPTGRHSALVYQRLPAVQIGTRKAHAFETLFSPRFYLAQIAFA